uniref:F-box domain-containing protein n=1 Tax=Oryza meridionalis TaxID=40149 RepID=A0A0E0E905_9ORYZ
MAPPPRKRRRVDGGGGNGGNYPLVATPNDGVLPVDLLNAVLLRLPARPACRLRAVCRPWRAVLSDPRFAAAHAARHPDPHLVVAACDRLDAGGIELVDVYLVGASGDVAKRVPAGRCDTDAVSSARDGVALLVGNDRRLRVLDAAASAAVSLVPDGEHHPINCSFTLGRAASSSGEHKVLRIGTVVHGEPQVCAVLTLAVAGGRGQNARWREAPSPPLVVRTRRGDVAVAGGVAYFLLRRAYLADWIAAFDLEAEQWRPALVGGPPLPAWRPTRPDRPRVTLAELGGSLVVAIDDHRAATLDLWFLLAAGDGEQHWSKQYTVTMPYHRRPWRCDGESAEPVVVLDDGRIVFWVWAGGGGGTRHGGGVMRVYDPITGGHTDVATAARCAHVGVYTGNLLSLVSE